MPRQKSDARKLIENRGFIDINNPQLYVPWIKTNEFTKSDGTRYCIKDFLNGRSVHFMSGLEKDYYLITRWNDKVIQIFEQVPLLPIDLTKKISEECGYKHPTNPNTKEIIVMTTDFLILVKQEDGSVKWFARAVKPKDQLIKKRVREKLDIEAKYWEEKGIKWAIITEDNVDKIYADNVELIMNGFSYTKSVDNPIEAIKYLIASKSIYIDMSKKIDLEEIRKKIIKDGTSSG